jgi:hypothetical protein
LTLGATHTSAAGRRKQQDDKRRIMNARIRKHENIRMANRDHPVFLSAKLRQQIQRLLKGDAVLSSNDPAEDDNDDGNNDAVLNTYDSDKQAYVEERLHQEGFTKRQARTAFEKQNNSNATTTTTTTTTNSGDSEDQWDQLYDDCLQWLCIHLDEDQLPEGFDPRGQTLEVVGGKKKTNTTTTTISQEGRQLVQTYGVSEADARWLLSKQKDNTTTTTTTTTTTKEEVLWKRLCELAEFSDPSEDGGTESDTNQQVVQEETEALEAIFPSDCSMTTNNDGTSTIVVKTPEEFTLTIVIALGKYPSSFPLRVLVSGNWPKRLFGVGFHVELIKFMATLTPGEPMIFELYGQMQQLLQAPEEIPDLYLSSSSSSSAPQAAATRPPGQTKTSDEEIRKRAAPRAVKKQKRPRQRSVFWSTLPKNTSPAIPFTKSISKAIERQRNSLPAKSARSDFISILRGAEQVSIVLVPKYFGQREFKCQPPLYSKTNRRIFSPLG